MEEFEKIIEDSMGEIIAHQDFVHFVHWMKSKLSGGPLFTAVSSTDMSQAAFGICLSIWNATPLPENNFRPDPVPFPGRNEKCPCGSGKKFKKCCNVSRFEIPTLAEGDIWPIFLEHYPEAELKQALEENRLPLLARVYRATEYFEGDQPEEVLNFLKSYYLADSFPDCGDDAGYGLTMVFDSLDMLGRGREKMAIIDHVCGNAPPSPLRSDALQRLTAIQAGMGMLKEAKENLSMARKDTPDDPGIAVLELQILLLEEEYDKARQRARFLKKKLERQAYGDDFDGEDPLVSFLEGVIDNPEASSEMMRGSEAPATTSLSALLEEKLDRPVPQCRFDEMTGYEQKNKEPYVLVWAPGVVEVEQGWRTVCPCDQPFSINLETSCREDPWIEERPGWMTFLLEHPEAFDSVRIIDDLLGMIGQHPDGGSMSVMGLLADPLLDRALEIARQVMEERPENGCLPWIALENRPALRLMTRMIIDLIMAQEMDEAVYWMQTMLEINPDDNHGFRSQVVNHYLQADENHLALQLIEQYDGDVLPELLYGRALALYRLKQTREAEQAAILAKESLPKVASYLIAPQRKEPQSSPYGVTHGGAEQAWLYRRAMRDCWKSTRGSLAWLKRLS